MYIRNMDMMQCIHIPGPSKGCQMVHKGCRLTIPEGLIDTPWKVHLQMFCIYISIYTYIIYMNTHIYVSKSSGQHLLAFWSQHLQSRPMVLGGASLGGGIAMDFAVEHPEVCYRSGGGVEEQGADDGWETH